MEKKFFCCETFLLFYSICGSFLLIQATLTNRTKCTPCLFQPLHFIHLAVFSNCPLPQSLILETAINTIETSFQVLFNWFSDNFMKANSGKSHLLMSSTETTHANIDGSMIKSTKKEILLGINIDGELKFEDHVNFM